MLQRVVVLLLAVAGFLFGIGYGVPASAAAGSAPAAWLPAGDREASSTVLDDDAAAAPSQAAGTSGPAWALGLPGGPPADADPATGDRALPSPGESTVETLGLLPGPRPATGSALLADAPRPPSSVFAGPPYLGGLLRPPCGIPLRA